MLNVKNKRLISSVITDQSIECQTARAYSQFICLEKFEGYFSSVVSNT